MTWQEAVKKSKTGVAQRTTRYYTILRYRNGDATYFSDSVPLGRAATTLEYEGFNDWEVVE